ncbi:phosphoglycerate dehydrogenase [Geoalkalibacter halelectricus]|uniref:D-3-phosphoglycerate dehydrogenase n=1 Tax=Geoalkalibacter halelectricus TaxID=2847045 RepID=A0ABY5ZLI6_9BACT|nr:phosphoglycerate dehydrogenase [Geoalkalibacter halelectricus]UWZ80010.1 phosphoglycerate dehydrogenase [Geoalkalibacter halelectricus]
MRVLVSDKLSVEGLRIFEETEGIEVDYLPGAERQELLRHVAQADALVVRAGTQVDAEVFEAATRLKVVGRAGIGVENVDLAAANRKGVVVMNTPFGSAITSAEHTLAMLLALARNIPAADRAVKDGTWSRAVSAGVEISGKVLGVIGAGKIGRLVIERAVGLKMRVLVHDPYLSPEMVRQLGAEPEDFPRILTRSDFLTLHVPLNSETFQLLDESNLSQIKPGCRIINCAQGGLIDEAALARAIEAGRVAGAALDVFAKEPPEPDNPLLKLDQVICTPHIRTSSVDAQINVSLQVAHQVVDFLLRGVIVNALNVPCVSAELLPVMRPYFELAEKLGAFQAQLSPRGLKRVTIEYAGDIVDFPTAPMTMALLKGLMAPLLGEVVNYVNAPHLARERGVAVVEVSNPSAEGYSNLIRLTVETGETRRVVAGALFDGRDLRIVRIDDHQLEAMPEGHILVLLNVDRPGVIGFIGQVLAEADINIAMMNLSRRTRRGGEAVSLITVDSPVPEAVLARLLGHESILSAVQVEL